MARKEKRTEVKPASPSLLLLLINIPPPPLYLYHYIHLSLEMTGGKLYCSEFVSIGAPLRGEAGGRAEPALLQRLWLQHPPAPPPPPLLFTSPPPPSKPCSCSHTRSL
ncbi:unnamed protein product [Pleuronectes platessa]|uniref:Uncharacterized protein n=1 Tax=Pleuronectes platessa TaxID=8262 RepID=A0A9N7U964_PLEPL|nr:unnamed protein product [Pleuronectes platessa]